MSDLTKLKADELIDRLPFGVCRYVLNELDRRLRLFDEAMGQEPIGFGFYHTEHGFDFYHFDRNRAALEAKGYPGDGWSICGIYALPPIPQAAARVPDGWGMVPKEPDKEMLNAARDWSHTKYGIPIGNDAAIGCWKAMHSAAPKPDDGGERT